MNLNYRHQASGTTILLSPADVERFVEAKNCTVHRIRIKHDVTTKSGQEHVMSLIEQNKGKNLLLFASMPCTGGSPWQNLNIKIKGVAAKVRAHWKVFRKIWSFFVIASEAVLASGGNVAIEWPRQCRYWQWDNVLAFLKKHKFESSFFDGCMYNLRSTVNSMLIKKPWRIDSTIPKEFFPNLVCDKTHDHTPFAGKDTKMAECYTDDIVSMFIMVTIRSLTLSVNNIAKTV